MTKRIATVVTFFIVAFAATGCAVPVERDGLGAMQQSYDVSETAPAKFEIFRGTDGQYYFHLRAGNGEIVLSSEGYTRKASADNGIESVKNNGVDLASYQLLEASNGEWYFNLRAKNYQVIGTSETYASRSNAERGAETVRELVAKLLRYEAGLYGGAGFEIFEGSDGQYYFHLLAANHEIILASEGYTTIASARNGVESVRTNGKSLDSFVVEQASNGQYYFTLVAGNGEVIGMSELYVSKYNAERGAGTVADLLYSERVADPQ